MLNVLRIKNSGVKKRNGSFLGASGAQSLLEHVILISIVTSLLVALGPLIKRGIQAVVRLTADQFANQVNAEQKVTTTSGYLVSSYATTSSQTDKKRIEVLGDTLYNFDDQEAASSTSFANLGYTKKN